jgi:hypothetical protein
MPMLDQRNAVVNAGGGRCQTWISDGTAQAIELMSNSSHICTSVHNAATRICQPPVRWFSSLASAAEDRAEIIFCLPRFPRF